MESRARMKFGECRRAPSTIFSVARAHGMRTSIFLMPISEWRVFPGAIAMCNTPARRGPPTQHRCRQHTPRHVYACLYSTRNAGVVDLVPEARVSRIVATASTLLHAILMLPSEVRDPRVVRGAKVGISKSRSSPFLTTFRDCSTVFTHRSACFGLERHMCPSGAPFLRESQSWVLVTQSRFLAEPNIGPRRSASAQARGGG